MANVRCYAGASYPERPVAFEWEGRWLDVIEVRRQARTPEGLAFDVLAEDDQWYHLEWTQAVDEWTVRTSTGKMGG
jgi:hypothetical protein